MKKIRGRPLRTSPGGSYCLESPKSQIRVQYTTEYRLLTSRPLSMLRLRRNRSQASDDGACRPCRLSVHVVGPMRRGDSLTNHFSLKWFAAEEFCGGLFFERIIRG